MESFEPLINLMVLMSTLSIAAERVANVIKLHVRQKGNALNAKERERQVAGQALAVSILLAFAVKADLFQILSHLNAPWETLGWVRPAEGVRSVGSTMQAWGGMIMTGIALGFGSKFWHDVLDVANAAKGSMRRQPGGRSP